jgi:hypothetical protein
LALGQLEKARVSFEEAAKGESNHPALPDARWGLALCKGGGQSGSVDIETVRELSGAGAWGGASAAMEYAKRIEGGAVKEAYLGKDRVMVDGQEKAKELARIYFQKALLAETLESGAEKEGWARLEALTQDTLLNPAHDLLLPFPQALSKKVGPGEILWNIAKKAGVPAGQISRINRLDGKATVMIGQTLRILPGKARILIDRWRLTATLTIDGAFIKRYFVGIGPGEKTPEGTFTIRCKQINPDWYWEGRRIPYGHPENILGTRWMGFDRMENGGKGAGIGIHGTADPKSVPGRKSKGCIRMQNAEVEELFDFVPPGTEVAIQ